MILLKRNQIENAAKILSEGHLIAFPTETVFGLGVVFDNEAAYKNLITVKRRPPEKPFTLMCADKTDIEKYAYVNKKAEKLIKAFMPGQFTIILKAKKCLPSWAVSKEGMVGIRIPDDKTIRELIRLTGKPLLVPSANRSGQPPLTNHLDVIKEFGGEVDAIMEGESTSNVPSTIVLVDDKINIIRVGLITEEEIKRVLKE